MKGGTLERKSALALQYFEDVQVGDTWITREYEVTKEDIIEFAKRWDPRPYHMDEQVAALTPFGGLTASSAHTLAISILLGCQFEREVALLAGLGWEEVIFPAPVRPGDRLVATFETIEKRESKSKPDRGIVCTRVTVTNQRGETVLSYKIKVIMARCPARGRIEGGAP